MAASILLVAKDRVTMYEVNTLYEMEDAMTAAKTRQVHTNLSFRVPDELGAKVAREFKEWRKKKGVRSLKRSDFLRELIEKGLKG